MASKSSGDSSSTPTPRSNARRIVRLVSRPASRELAGVRLIGGRAGSSIAGTDRGSPSMPVQAASSSSGRPRPDVWSGLVSAALLPDVEGLLVGERGLQQAPPPRHIRQAMKAGRLPADVREARGLGGRMMDSITVLTRPKFWPLRIGEIELIMHAAFTCCDFDARRVDLALDILVRRGFVIPDDVVMKFREACDALLARENCQAKES